MGMIRLVSFMTVALVATGARGQTFTTLASFGAPNGFTPYGTLAQGQDGNLYGTTLYGEPLSQGGYGGSIFSFAPGGTLTTTYFFCSLPGCTDGFYPYAGLLTMADGKLYGTTGAGGAYDAGTVFAITPAGLLTTLYSFNVTDGADPMCRLIAAANGSFYGTTDGGGRFDDGTIFALSPSGTLTTLHNFDNADGAGPNALLQANDGSLYGTTQWGGTDAVGTIFRLTATGTLQTLHSFEITDGAFPVGLIQALDGNFYGTTSSGGGAFGIIFKITSGGTFTTLHRFNSTEGAAPRAGLVQGTDGNFYGTTSRGGDNDAGTIFRITPGGAFTLLHSFTGGADGATPWAALMEATDGDFYGTTFGGGTANRGVLFSLSVGLQAFVKTLPHSGRVGEAIQILGSDLTGATSVMFNGAEAAFTIVSATQISAIVPAEATTGYIDVITPGGTLLSGGPFVVGR